ncbi:hypothetical protein CDL15_Pgr015345 [Punica granatum]|nr:hypothetical protein CDL15_Pgr015345 [Punica granatum]
MPSPSLSISEAKREVNFRFHVVGDFGGRGLVSLDQATRLDNGYPDLTVDSIEQTRLTDKPDNPNSTANPLNRQTTDHWQSNDVLLDYLTLFNYPPLG